MNGTELRVTMVRNQVTAREAAAKLGISEQALYNKMNGVAEFKNSEIIKLAALLHLTMEDVNAIFFGNAVN